MKYLLLIVGLVFFCCLSAQSPTLPSEKLPLDGLPKLISLRGHCPPVGAQGRAEACAAWATAYGALGILAVKNQGTEPHQSPIFSASYVYNSTIDPLSTEPCKQALSITDALRFLQKEGTCLEKTFANTQPCQQRPNDLAKAEAQQFRITDYESVFRVADADELKINQLCSFLAKGEPIIVGLEIGQSFQNVAKGQTMWQAKNEPTTGGHALVVVGYDLEKKTVDLMNSWGTDWADKGFIKMSFTDFLPAVKQAFRIVGFVPKTLGLSKIVFSIKNTEGGQNAEKPSVNWQNEGAFYQFLNKNKTANWFQLVSESLNGAGFLYLIQKDRVVLELPFSKNTPLVLPAADEAFDLHSDFCLLVSAQAIPYFEQRFKNRGQQKGSFESCLKTAFGDILMPFDNLIFEKNKLGFTVLKPDVGRFVVAILVKY